MGAQHIVNISGGKDSQATALVARQRGVDFRLVMSDSGNENQIALDHAAYVADFLGVDLEMHRADFSEQIARKRQFIVEKWPEHGVPADRIERVLEILHPTGIPFLDLCLWKGRFPSRRAQFCTEWLKSRCIEDAVIYPALQVGNVVQWLGVRRDESIARRNTPMFQRVRRNDCRGNMLLFRPLIHWTAENVFGFSDAFGMRSNPLYKMGMARVGCFPCINENKNGLRQIKQRFPEAVEKLMEWEALVKEASKWGAATFFASTTTPEGRGLTEAIKREAHRIVMRDFPDVSQNPDDDPDENGVSDYERAFRSVASDLSNKAPWPRADQVFEWSETTQGGRQFDLFAADEGVGCSSQYGLCE